MDFNMEYDFEEIAEHFINWLINFEYVDPEDKGLYMPDMTEDLKNAYKVAPKLINFIRCTFDA